MSAQLQEKVGQTVGYTIRDERALSNATRIEVITEGILTRRLQHDPELEGVGLIVFDEFHERNLHSDLGLALSRDVQQGLRPDLRLLLMSATLESEQISTRLGQCPVIHSKGRTYPVSIHYCGVSERPLEYQVGSGVRRGLKHDGDVLVFLPGAGAIRRCCAYLRAQEWARELKILPLYGALPFEQQQEALHKGAQRKVVLATNIAETSLTIDGVRIVVDSGLERQLQFDAPRGMNHLPTRRISRASATQRAGRSGRQGPGYCYRLWSEEVQGSLGAHQVPEIARSDLTSLALELACWGVRDTSTLEWITPPPAAHLDAAYTLLARLGAVDHEYLLTPVGRTMVDMPVHPRLARMLVAAASVEEQVLACHIAVILEHPHLFRRLSRHTANRSGGSGSDIQDILESWLRHRYTREENPQAARALEGLMQRLGVTASRGITSDLHTIADLLLAAFPDRVGALRPGKRREYLLRSGRGAVLSARSALEAQEWIVAPEVEQRNAAVALIHMGSVLNLEQIERAFPEARHWHAETFWDEDLERVQTRRCRRLDALVLQQQPCELDRNRAFELMLEQIRARGLEVLNWTPSGAQLLARIRFITAHELAEQWPDMSPRSLLAQLEAWLGPWLEGVGSLKELRQVDVQAALRAHLGWEQEQELDRLAPTRIEVPSGSRVRVDYSDPEQPRLAVKLQELFGLDATPRIGGGRVALLLELLSPAQRPIQTTTDLESFWANTYAEVKKELKGRYPKHPWPDDPTTAPAQRGVKRRR
jgi:ATP-dependent helicase HrpB